MRVCLLTHHAEHPLLAALPHLLGRRHRVTVFDADDPDCGDLGPTADLYLLKSHSPRAVSLARRLERLGGRVVNGADATERCLDRGQMADLARRSGLPFPNTRRLARLSDLAHASAPGFPLIVKSRASRCGDLVARLDRPEQVRALEGDWADEPVVVQELVANDGLDHKLWVIGERVFAGLRGSPLDGVASKVTRMLDPWRLPAGWLDLTRTVGEVFGLRIYGVDILDTGDGPMVVDVNPFPGCRGVPGAPRALATFVRQATPHRNPAPRQAAASPVAALHEAVRDLVGALDRDAAPLRVSSLRRKPGRGLTASYRCATGALVTVRLDESALANPRAGELFSRVDPAEPRGRWPGVLRCPRIGLTLQSFPHDAELPALPAACATAPPDGAVATALTAAARTVLEDPRARVEEVRATPVRYKPAARCVLRYEVRLSSGEELVFFGKLYRDLADAAAAHRLGERLWAVGGEQAAVPRTLGLVEELGLVLTETAGGAHGGGQLPGTALLRPPRRARDGVRPPHAALAASAAALAWLHTSTVSSGRTAPDGPRYAARVRAWAHALSGELDGTVQPLAEALERTGTAQTALVHGAFKPSQLVFCPPGHPVITDLDGTGQGDPALDVGYFLAYLRPTRPRGNRAWYEAAREAFLGAYLAALADRGADPGRFAAVPRRAALFDAALQLKIASRRVRRLSSPRPAEPRAVAAEIERCLERFAEGGNG
ncbi:phosphotransferase [Streptantibioticus rubrisoli]|uniref:Phosphotransferase n=1 Tax=Streptantibioticus rubrisoli TaxID=1387313 RepID=A0ABT1PDY6_9ACTN|nr:phosphotransferase [Streptantibioticus rubrisoli]MCQ4042540.1 phosphotransferase [Streptantibioticus rubrisoli]